MSKGRHATEQRTEKCQECSEVAVIGGSLTRTGAFGDGAATDATDTPEQDVAETSSRFLLGPKLRG